MGKKILSINDTVHGMIELTAMEKDIISGSIFNRLHDVYQNSTLYLTFPTNRTKRFEHSIGAMYLCGEMLFNSLYNAASMEIEEAKLKGNETGADCKKEVKPFDDFLETAYQALEKVKNELCKDEIIMKMISVKRLKNFDLLDFQKLNVPEFSDSHINKRLLPFYDMQSNKPENAQLHIVLNIIYQTARIAALLHDIGHPPFSHITEKVFQNLYQKAKNLGTERAGKFCTIYSQLTGEESGNEQLHEIIGKKFVDTIFYDLTKIALSDDKSNGELTDSALAGIIYKFIIWRCVKAILDDEEFWCDIHKIIDGEVDCDRLDYVMRDGLASGVKNLQLEYQRIISGMQLRIVRPESDNETVDGDCENEKHYIFAFSAKSLNVIEDFLLKRMLLYRNVLFHHRVVKTDRLFTDVMIELGLRYLTDPSQSDQNHDEDNISFLWSMLENISNAGDTKSSLVEWDDSHLITVLKHSLNNLIKLYQNEKADKTDKILKDKLNEILTNKKFYFSAIKRSYDFDVVDKAFCEKIQSLHIDESKLKKQHDDIKNFMLLLNNKRVFNSETGYFTSSMFALQYVNKLLFNIIYDNDQEEGAEEKRIKTLLDSCLARAQEQFNRDGKKIEDAIIEVKTIKGRIAEQFYVYRAQNAKKELIFTDESNINNMIELMLVRLPWFYVYIKKADDCNGYLDMDYFLSILGSEIGNKIGTTLKNYIEK